MQFFPGDLAGKKLMEYQSHFYHGNSRKRKPDFRLVPIEKERIKNAVADRLKEVGFGRRSAYFPTSALLIRDLGWRLVKRLVCALAGVVMRHNV